MQWTESQRLVLQSEERLHASTLQALPAEWKACMRIVLEDGSIVVPRASYTEEVEKMANGQSCDVSWLRTGADGHLYFLTHSGSALPVLLRARGSAADGSRNTGTETMHMLIDQSGSMASMNEATYAGARELIQSLPADASVTFSTFGSHVALGERRSRDEALARLSDRVADGLTSLYDGIVQAVERECAGQRADIASLVILTDGQDTCSKSTKATASEAVKRAEGIGLRVMFLGCNQDALAAAQSLGIAPSQALTFDDTHVQTAFRSVAEQAANYRSTRAPTSFTAAQRQASRA